MSSIGRKPALIQPAQPRVFHRKIPNYIAGYTYFKQALFSCRELLGFAPRAYKNIPCQPHFYKRSRHASPYVAVRGS